MSQQTKNVPTPPVVASMPTGRHLPGQNQPTPPDINSESPPLWVGKRVAQLQRRGTCTSLEVRVNYPVVAPACQTCASTRTRQLHSTELEVQSTNGTGSHRSRSEHFRPHQTPASQKEKDTLSVPTGSKTTPPIRDLSTQYRSTPATLKEGRRTSRLV